MSGWQQLSDEDLGFAVWQRGGVYAWSPDGPPDGDLVTVLWGALTAGDVSCTAGALVFGPEGIEELTYVQVSPRQLLALMRLLGAPAVMSSGSVFRVDGCRPVNRPIPGVHEVFGRAVTA